MTLRHTPPDTLPLPLEFEAVTSTPTKEGRPAAAFQKTDSFSPPLQKSLSPVHLETAFAQLLGRKATAKEIAELHRVKNVLHLQDNDALWLILLSLDYYRHEIEKSVFESLKQVQATSKSTIEQAGQDYLKQLFPKLLTSVTDQITAKALGFNGSVIITGVIVLIALIVIGMGGSSLLSYNLGGRAGLKQCVIDTNDPSSSKPSPPPKGRGR